MTVRCENLITAFIITEPLVGDSGILTGKLFKNSVDHYTIDNLQWIILPVDGG